MRIRGLAAFTALALAVPIATASNLFIDPIYDSTITGNADASQIEGAIGAAIALLDATYSTPITVTIYFQIGGGLGQSNTMIYNENYLDYYNALVATNANPAAIAALTANGGDSAVNPVNDGGANQDDIQIKSANARAVGIDINPGCNVTPASGSGIPNDCAGATDATGTPTGTLVDGIVSLNTGITFPPNSQTGNYSLVAVAEHEIDEVLGLGSALENTNATSGTVNLSNDSAFGVGTPEDLFSYSAPTGGTRSTFSVNCASPQAAYFAYGPSTGEIAQFNNACDGGDFGDWASSGTPHVQDATATPSVIPAYSSEEEDALSAIGFGLANPEPEPATLALVGAALLTLSVARLRRRNPRI